MTSKVPAVKTYRSARPSRAVEVSFKSENDWSHIYAGTVPLNERQRRRKANRKAACSRRINRSR